MKRERFEGILGLDGPDGYRHFVKPVVDRDEAWGLYDDGWALYALDEGTEALPLWPEQEFAEACAEGDWASFTPKAIPLSELIEVVLPTLSEEGTAVAVFRRPAVRESCPRSRDCCGILRRRSVSTPDHARSAQRRPWLGKVVAVALDRRAREDVPTSIDRA